MIFVIKYMKDNQNELFVVVNEDDEIVGYRTRYECHHDKSLIHRATDVAIFNSKGEVLLQKRSQQKDLYPGFYTLSASGHVSKGEEYIDAAHRELAEELGISDIQLELVGKIMIETDDEREIVAVFKGVHEGPFTFPEDEVESVEFFPPDDVKKIITITPAAMNCMKLLNIL